MNKINLHVPILKKYDKTDNDEYYGILSNTLIDRDVETISSKLLKKWAKNVKSIPVLLDHENKYDNYHADWINLRTISEKGETFLIGDLDIFSTSKGEEFKTKLRKGRNNGVSITFLPFDYRMIKKKYKNKEVDIKEFTDGELLEASFTPIPSNKYSKAIHVAKKYNLNSKIKKFNEIRIVENGQYETKDGEKLMVNNVDRENGKVTIETEKKSKQMDLEDFSNIVRKRIFKSFISKKGDKNTNKNKGDDIMTKNKSEPKPKPKEKEEKSFVSKEEVTELLKSVKEELKSDIVEQVSSVIKKSLEKKEKTIKDKEEPTEKPKEQKEDVKKHFKKKLPISNKTVEKKNNLKNMVSKIYGGKQ